MKERFVIALVPPEEAGPDDIMQSVGKRMLQHREDYAAEVVASSPCDCTGMGADRAAWAAVKKARQRGLIPTHEVANMTMGGHIDRSRAYDLSNVGARQTVKALEERVRVRVLTSHPLRDKPDPECPKCGGKGVIETWGNPHARYANACVPQHGTPNVYRVMGGDGWKGAPPSAYYDLYWYNRKKGYAYGVASTLCPVAGYTRDTHPIPDAIVTPDGVWHDCRRFGKTATTKRWKKECWRLFQRHKNCMALGLEIDPPIGDQEGSL